VTGDDADLAAALEAALGEGSVSGLRRLSGGASRETFSFAAGERPLILQRQRPGAARSGMAREVAVLRAAHAEGVPVPVVVASDETAVSSAAGEGGSAGPLGRPWMVVSHVEGETIARKILRDEPYAAALPLLAGQCGVALARIHRIPAAAVPDLDHGDQVARFRATLDGVGEPIPHSSWASAGSTETGPRRGARPWSTGTSGWAT
jgi:aminoglycoside phosphotransferase (APT) family kinase protein